MNLTVQKTALSVTKAIGSPLSIIIHTAIFVACFIAAYNGTIDWNTMLLVLTTVVSLEAIYLSIFIQMTINYTTQELAEVGEDIEELQEDIVEIQEDVGEIQEDVGEIQEDVEEISEEVEATSEEDKLDEEREVQQKKTLEDIQNDLRRLMNDISKLQQPK